MKTLLFVAVLGVIAWFGYEKYKAMHAPPVIDFSAGAPAQPGNLAPMTASSQFSCDGRTRCSQMNSCDEATYFIRNCPNTEMDGDSDGVPCERQWCQ